MMNGPFQKFLTTIISLLFPLWGIALEKVDLSSGLFYKISGATMATPQKCRQFTLYSPTHKLYFVFAAAYNIGQNESRELDHLFIFQNKLDERSLAFYLEAYEKHPQVQQILNNSFHQDVPEDKFLWFSGIAINPKAVVAGYFLKEKFFRSSVYLFNNIKLRPVNEEPQEIKPVLKNIIMPDKLATPFDLSKISAGAKNLPPGKLSAELAKRVENGFLFRTLKNKYYYICENADGVYLAAFVDDKMVINCKFTNNHVISELSANDRFIQSFSTFDPFKCEIFFTAPDSPHPLFINVHNDDCKREIFTVNAIKKL